MECQINSNLQNMVRLINISKIYIINLNQNNNTKNNHTLNNNSNKIQKVIHKVLNQLINNLILNNSKQRWYKSLQYLKCHKNNTNNQLKVLIMMLAMVDLLIMLVVEHVIM